MNYDSQGIAQSIINNIIDFIEQPHPAFNKMPVCPFAKKARLQNLIEIKVLPFNIDDIDKAVVDLVNQFTRKDSILIVVHPDKDIDSATLNRLGDQYELLFPDLVVFRSHPLNEFQIDGLYTRREPYPNLQFVTKKHLLEARKSLSPKYYAKWSASNRADVGLPES